MGRLRSVSRRKRVVAANPHRHHIAWLQWRCHSMMEPQRVARASSIEAMTIESAPVSRIRSSGNLPPRFFSGQYYDRPIAETKSFFAVPSLGSLVPGWLLLVPKRQATSLAQLTLEEAVELKVFASEMTAKLALVYGEVVQFEHGATVIGSKTGCGVDQAHLHLVPLSNDRFQAAVREEGTKLGLKWLGGGLRPFGGGASSDYLWFSAGSRSRICIPAQPVSQFFRRCVARAIGLPDSWDYREHPSHDVVKATIQQLAA